MAPGEEGKRLERRLAAVMALDTVGYSRLMEADVEGTHRRLSAIMTGIVAPAIAAGGGHVVKWTGDGALAEFPSMSEAVRAAARIQDEAAAAERAEPAERQIRLRIGINLGDVIIEDDDIYGDGVNIAARLEGIGQPGDIIVSESAMQTADRAGYRFVDLGVQHLKNITRPVRAYRVAVDPGASGWMAADIATPIPGFGARPAIAVMPFRYRGPDPGSQEHVADGMTEDIIAALSRWRFFPVIARGSVFTYKGREVDPTTVGQQLGARYVLDGSLHRRDTKIRIDAELVDAETRETLLAERYDYDVSDMFAAQDEIVRTSIGVLEPELLRHEHERAMRVSPENATAYELFLRAQWHHYRYTEEDNAKARISLRRALDIAPAYAHASAGLALVLVHAANVGWVKDREAAFTDALTHARNAVRSDARDPMGHFALGTTLQNAGFPPSEAADALREAIRLDPSYAGAHANLGFVNSFMNRPEEAVPPLELALRLSPHDPRRFLWLSGLVISHYLGGRYRDALVIAQDSLRLKPEHPVPLRYLLATLGQLGRLSDATVVLSRVRKLDGGLAGTEAYLRRMFEAPALARIVDGLKRAGLT